MVRVLDEKMGALLKMCGSFGGPSARDGGAFLCIVPNKDRQNQGYGKASIMDALTIF
jgi:hypothetical protein